VSPKPMIVAPISFHHFPIFATASSGTSPRSAAEARERPAEDLVARVDRGPDHLLEELLVLVVAHVHVGEVVGLARRDHHRNLLHAVPLLLGPDRPLHGLHRRADGAVVDAGLARDAAEHLLGVGELREVLGVGEARGLEFADAPRRPNG